MSFTFADLHCPGRIFEVTRENHPEKDQMVKGIIYLIITLFLFSSCTSLKQLSFSNSKPVPSSQNKALSEAAEPEKKEIKFLENISASTPALIHELPAVQEERIAETVKVVPVKKTEEPVSYIKSSVESASALQIKYAILLNTEVENMQNTELLKQIDQWYGTRYCMGGTTNRCIDCSAFMQILFSSVYSVSIPRTARDQYKASTRISRTEMKEGDLLFFNTRGGVSHVGFYLQNNKFVHASTHGVVISDIYESYYLRRFIGVGRIDKDGMANSKTNTSSGSR